MKKIVLLTLLLFIATPLFGQSTVIVAKKKTACSYTSKNAQTGTGGNINFNFSGGQSNAVSFAANGTYSPRRITVSLKKTGTPTATVYFYIRQDAGESTSRTEPGAVVITATGTLECEDLTTDYAAYTVDIAVGDTAQLTNANIYWLHIIGTTSSSNYLQWQYSSSGSEEWDYDDSSAASWTQNDTSVTGNFTIWSCE